MTTAMTSDRHEATDRYAVALTTPLIEPEVAVRSKRHVVELLARDPSPWLLIWAASLLHDLVATLPQEDPWRSLAGGTEGITITAPGVEVPEGRNGAWSRDGEFGSVRDSLDLVRVANVDLSRDPGLAPVAEPLQADSAALLAAAGHSAQTVFTVLNGMCRDLAPAGRQTRAGAIMGAVDPAIRRALHRRMTYTGLGDPFPAMASGAAKQRADAIVGDQVDPLDWRTPLALAGQIDAGTYDAHRAAALAAR